MIISINSRHVDTQRCAYLLFCLGRNCHFHSDKNIKCVVKPTTVNLMNKKLLLLLLLLCVCGFKTLVLF